MSKKTLLASRPDLPQKFAKLLSQGVTIVDACRDLEVPVSCFKEWRRWGTRVRADGAPAKEPYRTFARKVNEALAQYEAYLLDEIHRQGRDARWSSDGEQIVAENGVVIPAHKKGDIILMETGRVARPGSWHANAWLLEKRFPKKYALRLRVELTETYERAVRAFEREFRREPEILSRAIQCLSLLDDDESSDTDLGRGGPPPAGGAPPPAVGGAGSPGPTTH